MSLESGTYISALDSVNPTGSDPKSRGDDHLRLIKSTLKNSFAGITGAVQVGGTNGGVANVYTLTPTPALVSYVTNMTIVFSPVVSNTGASTIDVSGLGAINLRSVSGAALISGELALGQTYKAVFNGTEFRLDSITKTYTDQLAFSTALPAQSLGFLASNGTVAAFTKSFTGYAVDESKSSDVSSASTINLSNTVVTGNIIHVTGTTTINAITLPSGAERTLVFDGILQLTHSANLILPGSANVTTTAGDVVKVRGDGASIVRVVSYQRANGDPLKTGAYSFLGSIIPSASANVDFLTTFNNSIYDSYEVISEGLRPATDAILQLRLAVSGTPDSGNNYVNTTSVSGGEASASLVAQGNLSIGNVAAAGLGYNSAINIVNAADTALLKSIHAHAVFQTTGGTPYVGALVSVHYIAANAVTGFRLFWSTGANFTAGGAVTIYGRRKTA